MISSMHERFLIIAEEDNDREAELGSSCPSRLRLLLVGGETLDCMLVDGLNSVDDETVDVYKDGEPDPERGIVWVVRLQHIAAMRVRYPTALETENARARASATTEVALVHLA